MKTTTTRNPYAILSIAYIQRISSHKKQKAKKNNNKKINRHQGKFRKEWIIDTLRHLIPHAPRGINLHNYTTTNHSLQYKSIYTLRYIFLTHIPPLLVLKVAGNNLVNIRTRQRLGANFIESAVIDLLTLCAIRGNGYD